MPIFFESRPKRSTTFPAILLQALRRESIVDPGELQRVASELTTQAESAAAEPPMRWGRVVIALVLLIALYAAAMYTPNEEASKTLLRCFEVLFTATLGLFGIEAAKNG